MSKATRIQLIIHLIKHEINIISTELNKVSIFQLQARQDTKKKVGVIFENCKCKL